MRSEVTCPMSHRRTMPKPELQQTHFIAPGLATALCYISIQVWAGPRGSSISGTEQKARSNLKGLLKGLGDKVTPIPIWVF